MKKISILIFVLVCLILFGCSNKSAITYKEFKDIAEKNKYTVVEVTEQFGEYNYIKGAYLAVSHDTNYQVEFYTFEDNDGSKSFYDLNKEIFESQASSNDTYTNKDTENYNKYTLTTEDKYYVIIRNNNTVLYSSCDKTYKDNVVKLIKKLGY